MFLLIDTELNDEKLQLLGDLLNVSKISEDDELLENIPESDLYIINISKSKLIHFYETNKNDTKNIIYYKTKNIFRDDSKIGYNYILKNFPKEAKSKEELVKKLKVNNEIEKVSKCGSCFEFCGNQITWFLFFFSILTNN
jgi:hypothetical protein